MKRRTRQRGLRLAGALAATVAFCIPIYIAFVNAFKTTYQIFYNPLALPWPPTLDNIVTAFQRSDHLVQGGLTNSVIVTGATLILVIPLGSLTSLWVFRLPPKPKSILLGFFAFGLMVPPQVGLQPTIRLLQALGLHLTYPGLILVNVGGGYLAFAVFVYVGFLRTVSQDVIEAARVDGAGEWRIWWSVVMPLIRPATVTVGIFVGLWTWNDFLSPLLILGPLKGQTITVGMYLSMSTYSTDYGQMFGIMLLAAVIPVAGYLISQREFIYGLMSGASKG
ncbi:MAG: carbohydrate ABC transporter permease [Propionibacteriaceae bacterium]|nr:carbohydrate ABC transporter permease [Propionibacteriaceae bacterium]